MAIVNTEKQIIATANLTGLTEGEFMIKAEGFGQAMIDNSTLVPGIAPAGTVVITKVDLIKDMFVERDSLEKAHSAKTIEIAVAKREVKDIITNKWAHQVETACGRDLEKYKTLGYGVKGVFNGTTEEIIGRAFESHPLINLIDNNVHLQHVLHIINNVTGNSKLPEDAKHIDVYELIGGTVEPVELKQMQYLGIAKNNKFINHFDAADVGKLVYYIVVYIDKETLKPLEISPVVSMYII